jgi:hypothetical protein
MKRVSQSSPFGRNRFPARNAFKGGRAFTHTNRGVGMWWQAFFRGQSWVYQVKIKNRADCCGGRLARTKVMIGSQVCGHVQNGTRNGAWYTVKCKRPVRGDRVRLITTRNTYLSISGIQVWAGRGGRQTRPGKSVGYRSLLGE